MGHNIAKCAPFGALLRQYRLAAALSQEALAERAALSTRGISNLERGLRLRPHLTTVALLADALALSPGDRAGFVAAARAAPPSIIPEAITEPPNVEAGASSEQSGASAAAALPAAPLDLVGRAAELAAARDLLWQGQTRLLTLTGPGGVGKTHLALALAAESRAYYADGVVFVTLALVRDPALVAALIARALGVQESDERPVADLVAARLRERRLLLVLDNFEHVAAAAPLVADLLASCPSLTILVTSRSAAHVRGERELPVLPLTLPAAPAPGSTATPLSPESLWDYAATDLFVRRARIARPLFAPTVADAPAIAAICRRLDGLPLAIELAAARIKLLSPRALLDRLDKRLPLLVGGARDLPERQQTMRSAIAWSYDLLQPGEQALFRRLAVFQGGAALDAIEDVCGPAGDESNGEGGGNELAGDILLWLESLVDQSLLQREESPDGEPRVTMLETIREYAAERLVLGGDEAHIRARHAAHYLALAEEAEPRLIGADQAVWLRRLDEEHGNLRAALHWVRETGAVDRGLRLAAALWRFWYVRGHLGEGRGWLESMVAAAERGGSADRLAAPLAIALGGAGVLAKEQADFGPAAWLSQASLKLHQEVGNSKGAALALNNLGTVAYCQGDYEQAARLYADGLARFRTLGDQWGIALLLNNAGLVAHAQGQHEQAARLYGESLDLARAMRNEQGVANALGNLANVAGDAGDYDRAVALYEDGLTRFRALEDTWGTAQSLNNLAAIAYWQGDDARAWTLAKESLTLRCDMNDKQGIAESLCTQGNVAQQRGDNTSAVALFKESLALAHEIGDQRDIAASLEGLAALARVQGQTERAVRLWAAAATVRDAMGTPIHPTGRAGYDHALAAAHTAVGDDAFDAAWTAGAALPLDRAVAYALSDAP